MAILLIATGSCEKYELPKTAAVEAGTADFTKTVAVGSSIIGGFMNGTLYTEGQNNSSVAIMAKQMKLVKGGDFIQPDINAAVGDYGITFGLPSGTVGRLFLKLPATPANPACTTASPAPAAAAPGNPVTVYAGDKTKLNSFTTYRVTLQTSMLPALGGPAIAGNPAYSPWYARYASAPSANGVTGSTLVGDAATALTNGGTFFVFWLGIDDVLGWALNGGDDALLTPLTTPVDFTTRYNTALGSMLTAKASAKGILGNVPNLTSLPHFTAVKWNPVVFLSCDPVAVGTVASLNAGYGGYNAALDAIVAGAIPGVILTAADAAKRKVVFKTGANATLGANAAVMVDETLPNLGAALGAINAGLAGFGQVRQTTPTDLLLLTAGSVLPTGVGVNPAAGFLTDRYVLIPSEQASISANITAFNATIKAAVDANADRLALVDANTALKNVEAGTVFINGSAITSSVAPPSGAFSLDGVHPNSRGQAYIANLMIGAINSKFKATIPIVNPNNYSPNAFPIP